MSQPVTSFAGVIWVSVKYLCVHTKRQIDYVKNIGENFKKLKDKEKDLYDRREDVNEVINGDKESKKPSAQCTTWLDKVKDIENEVKNIEDEFKLNKRCLGGWCPHITSHYKLGKCIVATTQEITTLIENSEFKGGVVVGAPPRIVEPTPTPFMYANASTDRIVREILRKIGDKEIQKIGVWGMGGAGKTTIVKNLKTQPKIANMFQIVIWVTVSQDWSLRKVQKQMAERFLLYTDNDESDLSVANKIYKKLNTMKYLLLLDDVWDEIELGDVGVPIPTRENGCKIVLTTRSMKICNAMRTCENIKVEPLSFEEAWDLFAKIVGNVVNSPNVKPLARNVVEECDGLPLAITVIGGALRNLSDVRVWKDALRVLRTANASTMYDMEEKVFKKLQLSYDRLEEENVKKCFLYCALYPEDFQIREYELIDHWWAEGFIDSELSLHDAYNHGCAILSLLINACLLERSDVEVSRVSYNAVKMHDVIRDLALRITFPNNKGENFCKFLVRTGKGIEEPPNEELWKQANRISLMESDLRRLPSRPECTSLSTLLLQNNKALYTIPEPFFEEMPRLRVLNLSRTGISKLPSSFANLVILRGLYLDDISLVSCEMGHLSKLEMLHILPFVHGYSDRYEGGIQILPAGIEQLTCLRSLRLILTTSGNPNVMMIPAGVLSKLSLLEDLRIHLKPCSWSDSSSSSWFLKTGEVVAKELVSLEKLTHLEFPFPTAECLEHFIQKSNRWKKNCLRSFRFSVGDIHGSFREYEAMNSEYRGEEIQGLNLFGDNGIPIVVTQEVLCQSCVFNLVKHESANTMLSVVGSFEKINHLRYCTLGFCSAIETIIDGNGSSLTILAVLPKLEILELKKFPKFRTICEGSLPPESMRSLKHLTLMACSQMTKVFTWSMIQILSNLETLEVSDCEAIEEILADGKVKARVLFPRLKKLRLHQLPRLVRICKVVPKSIGWPSLNTLYIFGCANLKKFPLRINKAPVLSKITGEWIEWWESLEWEDDHITKQEVPRLYSQF